MHQETCRTQQERRKRNENSAAEQESAAPRGAGGGTERASDPERKTCQRAHRRNLPGGRLRLRRLHRPRGVRAARGKSGSNDANAEYIGFLRKIFDENGVIWQTGELGKVDLGGGGTIAYILANKGVDVIDCGVPVLSMHAPYEVTSKYDIYSAYKTYEAFWKE